MTAILEATALGKRYRSKWALSECTLQIPQGRVVGLVGPNGAGKTTLLQLAVRLLKPSAGEITVLDGKPAANTEQRGRVGFVAQDTPTYPTLSVADHLQLGARLNPNWNAEVAGIVLRKTLQAMAATLVGYIGMQALVVSTLRPSYQSPLHASGPIPPPPIPGTPGPIEVRLSHPGDWVISNRVTNYAGHAVNQIQIRPTGECEVEAPVRQ